MTKFWVLLPRFFALPKDLGNPCDAILIPVIKSYIVALLLIIINNTNSRYRGIPLTSSSSSSSSNIIRKGYGTWVSLSGVFPRFYQEHNG